ncbi:hypothetical protein [Actinoplanes sp. NBRC 103695]|uniref:hypothetical protein n=1 Tax=Actinoplanes sp. NBRC 103695 TaxID=3032202 RepID=UPI00255571CE|nr:hypothetical protein [Actinoplanes sp. NBRC 103695]
MIPRQRRPAAARPDFPADDPRSRTDGLGWVARAVFPGPALRLTVGNPEPSAIRYAVLPSLDDAKFLLPLASRTVTAASVLAYNALRPPRVRATRAVIGGLARTGLLGLTRAPVLNVTGGPLLTDHLAGLLGVPRLHAAIGVRPPDPHHKPTLQLFDDQGRPQGYAKIGWSDGTRAMVRGEVAALTSLPAPAGDFPASPGLILHTTWQDREVAVIAPMPRHVRRIRRPSRPRTAAMRAVARVSEPRMPFVESPFLAGWRRRCAGGALAGAVTPGATTVDDAIDALVDRDGDLDLDFGHWHGDWVPWNMGRHRGRLLVWDWENSAPGVPLGFDLAHQHFQIALSTRRLPAAACADAVDAGLRKHGPALGLDPARQRFVADAYLIELWLRTYQLSHGADWNPRLHPALLDTLAARLA